MFQWNDCSGSIAARPEGMYRRLYGNLRMWTARLLLVLFLAGLKHESHVPSFKEPSRSKNGDMALRKRSSVVADLEEGSPEYSVVHAIQETREKLQITQTELARRTGIDQGDISKLERGTRNPSLKLLKRLARGLGMELKISFVPIEDSKEDLKTADDPITQA